MYKRWQFSKLLEYVCCVYKKIGLGSCGGFLDQIFFSYSSFLLTASCLLYLITFIPYTRASASQWKGSGRIIFPTLMPSLVLGILFVGLGLFGPHLKPQILATARNGRLPRMH